MSNKTLYQRTNEMNDFQMEYQNQIYQIDQYLSNLFDEANEIEEILRDGLRYCVLNGGKRLRSILCVQLCQMLGGGAEQALPFAAAIECIHAYSLVHDDLPAMDNDDFRRGQPSCHKKYGEGVAILIGDALLNLAFELMSAACAKNQPYAAQAMKYIAKAAGGRGMIGGQLQDLAIAQCGKADETALIAMVERKTAALIQAGAVSGAYLAGANTENIHLAERYAYHLGIAFQLRDDLEDEAEDRNAVHDSPNFLNMLGREKTTAAMQFHVQQAANFLNKLPNHAFLNAMSAYLFQGV